MILKTNYAHLISFLAIMGLTLASCSSDQFSVELWSPKDCLKINEASGYFLHISGDLLSQSDVKRREGDEKGADRHAQEALFATQIAANYAKNYEVYCRR